MEDALQQRQQRLRGIETEERARPGQHHSESAQAHGCCDTPSKPVIIRYDPMTAFGPILEYALAALTSLFFLIDPIATVPVFLVMTEGDEQAHRCRMARRAAISCFVMLSAFALAGKLIFRLFGITLPAFEIAGGIILLLIGLDMVQARRSRTKEAPGEVEESANKDDVGIVPLGVPMLAGPG